ncbi:MAG: hypothetical protein FWB86_11750 [Treponema sp.]|nr:hypothetical protein [Treponema sp.]
MPVTRYGENGDKYDKKKFVNSFANFIQCAVRLNKERFRFRLSVLEVVKTITDGDGAFGSISRYVNLHAVLIYVK